MQTLVPQRRVSRSMQVKLLGTATGPALVINGATAIERGPELASALQKSTVRHVFLTHAAPTAADLTGLSVYGPAAVIAALDEAPTMKRFAIQPGRSVVVSDLRFSTLPLEFTSPAFGYVVEDGRSCIAVIGDTLLSPAIVETLNDWPRLEALFLTCAFPNRLQSRADAEHCLTPQLLGRLVSKLRGSPQIVALPEHAEHHLEIVAELNTLGIEQLFLGEPDVEFAF